MKLYIHVNGTSHEQKTSGECTVIIERLNKAWDKGWRLAAVMDRRRYVQTDIMDAVNKRVIGLLQF